MAIAEYSINFGILFTFLHKKQTNMEGRIVLTTTKEQKYKISRQI